MTDTLRNNLLGLPLDLAAINMARARSEGVPPLNVLRRSSSPRPTTASSSPYTSWVDFGENLKHPESLVNFVAAYGQHPTILTGATDCCDRPSASRRTRQLIVEPPRLHPVPASRRPGRRRRVHEQHRRLGQRRASSITGLDNVDLWVGGLAEMTDPFGGLLGTHVQLRVREPADRPAER